MDTKQQVTNPHLKSLNEFFDKIFVITIDRNKERQEFLNHHLQELDFEYFQGVEGKIFMNATEIPGVDLETAAKLLNRPMHLGEIGCALAHKYLWQHIVDKGYEKVLILEDDVILKDNNYIHLGNIFKQLPADWEFLFLGYTEDQNLTGWQKFKIDYIYPVLNFLKLANYDTKNILSNYALPYSKNLKYAGRHSSTFAYGIKRSAVERLIAAQTPVIGTSDHFTAHLVQQKVIKGFISLPKIFVHREGIISSIWHTAYQNS